MPIPLLYLNRITDTCFFNEQGSDGYRYDNAFIGFGRAVFKVYAPRRYNHDALRYSVVFQGDNVSYA